MVRAPFSKSADSLRRIPAFVFLVVAAITLPSVATAQVVIHEILAANHRGIADEDGDSSDWVELYNRGASAVDLTGYSLTDEPGDLGRWVFPETQLAAGAFLLVWCSGKDRAGVAPERIVEPNSPLAFDANLVTLGDEWRFLAAPPETEGPAADWKLPAFDDSSWPVGRPGFGFGADGLGTELPAGLGVVFLRRRFDFVPGQQNLVLQVRYDDGFVAYVNGARVASSRFPEDTEPTFASQASSSHSPNTVERFDLTPSLASLQREGNVLAIALLNLRPTSNDLVLFPELGTVPPIYHTSFELRSEGESLLLVDLGGQVRDRADFPPQHPDQSYGRSPDAAGPFLYHLTPTPRAPNSGPASPEPLVVADTQFSHDRGFYDAPFEVAITTAAEGAVIRYTLDGTEPTAENGMTYEGPIPVGTTTTLRARAFKPDHAPTDVDTHTYVFLDAVLAQNVQTAVARGLPSTWGGTAADYEMDRDVVGPGDRFGGIYAATIRDDLRSLPTLSIVMDPDDMFGPQGIYTNSQSGGRPWERACSVELISPDGDTNREFQENCGIRIQGGYFRQHAATRKHSLRLLFKREYGPAKLDFAWFGDGAVEEFDTVTLRAGANDGYSWDAARLTEQYTRDEFGRNLQAASGNAASHGAFVHLYINGLYWGLYNPAERPDHSFSASYYGGDKDDWDAIHDLAATNGDTRAWNQMVQKAAEARTSLAAYLELQGQNPDGTPNPEIPHLLDVPNYADYLIVNLWGGNWDWPWKNWWAGRDRTARSTGFKFYSWDYENTIGNNRSRSPLEMNALSNNFTSAGVPHQSLRSNPEYRLLFADRLHRLLFNGGVLAPESLVPRYQEVADSVERSIVAESARWGDQHFNPPLTLREWETERDWILGTYLPQRSAIVLGHMRSAGFYPAVEAPVFRRHGGLVEAGFRVLVRPGSGLVYYTLDGSDPRLVGGEVAPAAAVAEAPAEVTVVPASAGVRFHVPADESLGLDWTALEFDDADWAAGSTALGFETETGYEEIIATDVREAMFGVNASLYLRLAFDVNDPAALAFLRLRMRYDDGYVAYLNGVRVAARNAPGAPGWSSRSTRANTDAAAVVFEAADLGEPAALLRAGRNVLAVHALNLRPDDRDFLIQPELVAADANGAGIAIAESSVLRARTLLGGQWSALNEATFVVDSRIPLRITEIMYQPPAPPGGSRWEADEFEYLELQNVGNAPLDLSSVRLGGGVEFAFAGSAVESLAPGEHVLVVEDLRAFAERYDAAGMRIAGEYTGRLSNSGEFLFLEGRFGEPILDLVYSERWQPLTRGAGRSLVIRDPFAARESWSDATSWTMSQAQGGSPGRDDADSGGAGGRQVPGDASQDGRLNVTDAATLLRRLFLGAAQPLPCEGASIREGGNLALHDLDGSRVVDIADAVYLLDYLFRRGPPPALGARCVRIAGCGDLCAP
jgi:hypothetical protein